MSPCVWLFPANWTLTHDDGDLMLGQSLKRRANIKRASGQHHIFTRLYRPAAQILTLKLNSPLIGLNGVSGWRKRMFTCALPSISVCVHEIAVLDSKPSQAVMATNTGNYSSIDW